MLSVLCSVIFVLYNYLLYEVPDSNSVLKSQKYQHPKSNPDQAFPYTNTLLLVITQVIHRIKCGT